MAEERIAAENKFEAVDNRLESIHNKLGSISPQLDAISNALDDISNRVDRISQLLTEARQREIHNYRDRCITAVDIYSRLGYGMLCYIFLVAHVVP
ncbi:hypothetical protein PILCRDRAFT_815538 [Piloderma croceum F 1598]|uniref:t-SNARE coiled-coil homology domain-containing protein n=1 Tax=Piloderma croceum (strain F 1598) TaxID=765440 RepID=A0A0C3G8V3_PILCF|nr:hypothetical protein PILCRDRAFT_815538 [Piloderma croceum F 1598]